MSLSRSLLDGSPAKATFGGVSFYTRDEINTPLAPEWDDVVTSLYGAIDKAPRDFLIEVPLRLWGAWENLSTLFPAGVLNPVIGALLQDTSDSALVIHGRNQDRITFHNAIITRLADLYLGIDAEIFAADVVFSALIRNGYNPEDASSYFTVDTAAFSHDFAKTNYKRQRYSGAWGAVAGFTAFQGLAGVNIGWDLSLDPVYSANVGTIAHKISGFRGTCRCLPVEPTMAQLVAGAGFQGASAPLGRLLSAGPTAAADLTWTGSGVSVVLKNASIVSTGFAWGQAPLRKGETVWETTRGFSAGSPAAVATIA